VSATCDGSVTVVAGVSVEQTTVYIGVHEQTDTIAFGQSSRHCTRCAVEQLGSSTGAVVPLSVVSALVVVVVVGAAVGHVPPGATLIASVHDPPS
jgi:hypothetical protein